MSTITDSFNRADGPLGNADTGQAWAVLAGTFAVASNQGKCTVGGWGSAVVEFGAADQNAQITLKGTIVNGQGLCVRAVDANNFWNIHWSTNVGGIIYLYKQVATVYTLVGQFATGAANDGDVLRVQVIGNAWTVYWNGTPRITATDAALNTATKAGFLSYANNGLFDDFSVAAPAAPSANARITRQSIEAAQASTFAADNVRITRQSAELAQWSPYTLNNVRISRQSVEVAQLIPSLEFPENAARLTQQTVEVLYLDPPADTTHDQDCFSRMRRL